MDLDIEHICRICLGKGSLKPIFVTKGTFEEVVSCAEMITTCATVTVSEDDKLPAQICFECLISLKIAYKFRKKCESSYEFLTTSLNTKKEEESENEMMSSQVFEREKPISHSLVGNSINEPKCDSSYEFPTTALNIKKEEEDESKMVPSQIFEQEKSISHSLLRDSLTKEPRLNNEDHCDLLKMKMPEEHSNKNAYLTCFSGDFCGAKEVKEENKEEDDFYVEPVIEIDEGDAITNSTRLKNMIIKGKKKINTLQPQAPTTNKKIGINQRKYGYFITRGQDDVDLDPDYLAALYRIYKHRCEHCPRIYAVSTYFTVHVNKHLGIRPYHCDICNKNYPEERSHLKYHRQRKVKGSYKCEMCDRAYNSESSLRSHMKIHTGEVKWHPCSYCPLKYDQLSKLKKHVVVHTREKNLICQFCQKAFRFDRNLRIHTLTVHSAARPHKCDVCEKGFVTGYDLSVHKQKHLGVTTHHCQICPLGFFSSSELRSHVTVVHSNKNVITCKVCGACFVRSYDLNKHVILQHPSLAAEEGLDESIIKQRKITNSKRVIDAAILPDVFE